MRHDELDAWIVHELLEPQRLTESRAVVVGVKDTGMKKNRCRECIHALPKRLESLFIREPVVWNHLHANVSEIRQRFLDKVGHSGYCWFDPRHRTYAVRCRFRDLGACEDLSAGVVERQPFPFGEQQDAIDTVRVHSAKKIRRIAFPREVKMTVGDSH